MVKYLDQTEGWMSEMELDMLANLAQDTSLPNGAILEVGTWKGLTTSALTLGSSIVVCIEWFKGSPGEQWTDGINTYDIFLNNMKKLNRTNFVLIKEDSTKALPLLEGTPFKLAFIDGAHNTVQATKDIFNVWNILLPGGILIMHDIGWQSIKDAINKIFGTRQFDIEIGELGAFRK